MRVKLEIGLLHEEEREKAQEEKKETSCLSPVSRRSLTTLLLAWPLLPDFPIFEAQH